MNISSNKNTQLTNKSLNNNNSNNNKINNYNKSNKIISINENNDIKLKENDFNNNINNNDINYNEIFNANNYTIKINNTNDIYKYFLIIETKKDGNCFFEAFLRSVGIYEELTEIMDHYELIEIFRALIADIIKDNNIINDQSKKEYLECKNITIEQYCNNILKKAWADDFEIATLSKKYNLETRIIRKDGDIININNIGNDNCFIQLLFEYYHKDINYEGKNHFSCLFPKDSIYFGDIDSLKVIKKNIKCDILYKLINNNNEYQYKENDFCKINSIIDDNNNRLFIAFCNILGINKCYHKEMREIISETLKNINKIKPTKIKMNI